MKYEIWLYCVLVAQTRTYDLAYDIFEILHKRCPNTDLQIIEIQTGECKKSIN